jgi:hypothetical protein
MASTISRKPLLTGGCGVTTWSVQSTPNLKRDLPLEDPLALAIERVWSTMSWRQGIGVTLGSRSHGLVDRMDLRTNWRESIEVLITPIEDAYVVSPGICKQLSC